MSAEEIKIRKITQEYYSRQDVKESMFNFAKNREISPRYFEGFGARPDVFQYVNDVVALAKKGATSFHCSEEIWEDALLIETGMSQESANDLRIGWDLIIDIDCNKGINFSAIAAKAIIQLLKNHGIEKVGIKFSGSKGFHIIVPYRAFLGEAEKENIKDLFPSFPRKIMAYIRQVSEEIMRKMVLDEFGQNFWEKMTKNEEGKKIYSCQKCGSSADNFFRIEFSCSRCNIVEERNFKDGKGQLPKCYKCKERMMYKPVKEFRVCSRCKTNSIESPSEFGDAKEDLFEVMGLDLAVVSPRHLFRMPYSLHEKTSLASVVIEEKELEGFITGKEKFMRKIADPKNIIVRDFMPDVELGCGKKLVMEAKDWAAASGFDKEVEKKSSGKYENYKNIELVEIKENQFPPCVKRILEGLDDGKKRALFVLINLFRSIGMEKIELEKKIEEWNGKCKEPLKKGYIQSQLNWMYRRKPIMPQNCREFYRDIGVCNPDSTCNKIKNPVNYVVRKNFIENNKNNKKVPRKKPKQRKKKI